MSAMQRFSEHTQASSTSRCFFDAMLFHRRDALPNEQVTDCMSFANMRAKDSTNIKRNQNILLHLQIIH